MGLLHQPSVCIEALLHTGCREDGAGRGPAQSDYIVT